MAAEARRTETKDKQATKPNRGDTEAYRLNLDIWRRASRVQAALEAEGKEATLQEIWDEIGDGGEVPWSLGPTLQDERYKRLLDVERRVAIVGEVKALNPLRDLASHGAFLAISGALRDLALFPDLVSAKDKIALAKTLTDMHARISPTEAEADTLTGAAVDEEKQMEEALALIPEALRPQMREAYIQERIRVLGKTKALHLVEAKSYL